MYNTVLYLVNIRLVKSASILLMQGHIVFNIERYLTTHRSINRSVGWNKFCSVIIRNGEDET